MTLYSNDHPIILAVEHNDYHAVEEQLKLGVKPDASGPDTIPIQWTAINEGFDDIFRLLLDFELDPNSVTELTGESLLFRLIRMKRFDLAKYLIEKGGSVHHRDCAGFMAITLAAVSRNLEFFNFIREYGGNMNSVTDAGETLLFYCRSAEIAKLALDHGVDPNVVIRRGKRTALIGAAESGETYAPGVCRMLLERGVDVNHIDRRKMTALDYASDDGAREVIREFGGKSGKELLES